MRSFAAGARRLPLHHVTVKAESGLHIATIVGPGRFPVSGGARHRHGRALGEETFAVAAAEAERHGDKARLAWVPLPSETGRQHRRANMGAYILNLTGGNPSLASVGTNVTQRPMTGKTTLRRPHCN